MESLWFEHKRESEHINMRSPSAGKSRSTGARRGARSQYVVDKNDAPARHMRPGLVRHHEGAPDVLPPGFAVEPYLRARMPAADQNIRP